MLLYYNFRSLIVSTLEKVLNLVLTQIILCDRLSHFSARDKKLFKRELSSELVRNFETFLVLSKIFIFRTKCLI